MAFQLSRARSHAHSKRPGRFTVHGLVVSLAVGAVVFASQFPSASNASASTTLPTSLSGMAGTTQARSLTAFRPSASIQTMDSVATTNLRTEVLSVRAVGAVSPTTSLSSGVSAAAASLGEVGAGVKPLADIIDPRSPIVEYRTQGGDSISGIASRYGVSMATILANNPTLHADNPNLIQRDQIIIVPRKDGILYKVGYGDTVAKIVGQYDNIDADTVVSYKPNNIANPNQLEQGQYLLLPGATIKPRRRRHRHRPPAAPVTPAAVRASEPTRAAAPHCLPAASSRTSPSVVGARSATHSALRVVLAPTTRASTSTCTASPSRRSSLSAMEW
ncbi:LysM peptidoglycan-binding domain-containing protein [Candidatus Amarobacter glycogenicus]|uniref:LysM peptidoglycan-binding domain-containing protein n=1 Tax=Candidatus Amarobacter glycogenicus TaxID=3140699 RepID=UPI002A1015A7|nr:LysM peptidoglycan-binding domain-containing protein [Dehalococcoidia bacterium]